MSRKKRAPKRIVLNDSRYDSLVISKLINTVMIDGNKNKAEKIVYTALEQVVKKGKEDPLAVFEEALESLKPAVEVKSRRVGGATYQVPVEVRPTRRNALAMRWLVDAARKRGEKTMALRLAGEILDVTDGKGASLRKKEDVHRMAEANRAFSHYRF